LFAPIALARTDNNVSPISARAGQNAAMTTVLLRESMDRVEVFAHIISGACLEGDDLRKHMSVLRVLASYDPIDVIALRRTIAGRLLSAKRYSCD
jgi:hypothetical protein